MKHLLSLIFIFTFFPFYNITSQEVTLSNELNIEIRKIKIHKGYRVRNTRKTDSRTISIKCQIIAKKKAALDVNAFSLLDTLNKKRYRLSDYHAHRGTSQIGFGHSFESYLKTPILNEKGNVIGQLPKYNPTIKDSFENFKFEGYTNISTPIEFIITGDIMNHGRYFSVVYYPKTVKWEKFVAFLSFPLNNSKNPSVYQLYYGEKFISKIKVAI